MQAPRWQLEIDNSLHGVWRYWRFFGAQVPASKRIELGEIAPPVHVLGDCAPLDSLLMQREDLNPNGSHKDRSLMVQVSVYGSQGASSLCISSSGNAAISAAAACQSAGIRLFAFISPRTPPSKRACIAQHGSILIESDRAISLCREFGQTYGIPNLRPSTNDLALEGYKSIAFGWAEEPPMADSIFCYTSSGSTLCGIHRGFEALKARQWNGSVPALHAAQAGRITSVAKAFGETAVAGVESRSVIGDLGPRRPRRQGELVRAIRASGGHAWALSDGAIWNALDYGKEHGILLCPESACAIAAAMEAGRRGLVKSPLVLVTGQAEMTRSKSQSTATPGSSIVAQDMEGLVSGLSEARVKGF